MVFGRLKLLRPFESAGPTVAMARHYVIRFSHHALPHLPDAPPGSKRAPPGSSGIMRELRALYADRS